MTLSIESEAVCCGCGYDLRTLSFDASCPECGTSILITLCDTAERAKRGLGMGMGGVHGAVLHDFAARTRHTLDAVLFFSCAQRFAAELTRRATDPPVSLQAHPLSAHQLCRALRDLAVLEFGQAAPSRLSEWGLATRAEVATLVQDLVRFGAMQPSRGDSFDDFNDPTCPEPTVRP